MLPSIFVYIGFILVFIAGICLIKPLRFLRIRTRRHALILLVIGALVVVAGFSFPIHEIRIAQPRSSLDHFAPVYQFNEVHSIRIKASRPDIYRAINEVTANEISFFRTLTWIRRAGQSGRESILNPPPGVPIMQVATHGGFLLLADDPNREIVIGAPVLAPRGFRLGRKLQPEDFVQIRQPGFAFAGMNFQISDEGSGESILSTETRVYTTDQAAARKFARYWRIIYPGSSLIRYSWLRAIKRRAERGHN